MTGGEWITWAGVLFIITVRPPEEPFFLSFIAKLRGTNDPRHEKPIIADNPSLYSQYPSSSSSAVHGSAPPNTIAKINNPMNKPQYVVSFSISSAP
jgi:hypothetical protein